MNCNSLVSIDDISKDEILHLLRQAQYFEQRPDQKILDGKVVATLFSSRQHVPVSVLKQQSTASAAA